MKRRVRRGRLAAALLFAAPISPGAGADAGLARQSPSDAWWTGPLLAQSATTLPAGSFYTEPSLYDSIPYARFDSAGNEHDMPHEDELGFSLPLKYGVSDRLAIGATLRFGYDWIAHGLSSSAVGVGDPSVQLQYRLTQYQPGSWIPAFSINLQESLPWGRYDRLDRQTDGLGSGSETTTLATCFQWFFWMPNGRIVRARLDFFYAMSRPVSVAGSSVYGTHEDFRGSARPGNSASLDLAFEYSATRNWVLASDFWLERDASTRVAGTYPQPRNGTVNFLSLSGTGRDLVIAPAIEYNWSSRLGIIFGVRITAMGRNERGFVTPVAALSYLH
ncbi:MAG TPA: hypothetical protein VGR92_10450 [Steroidobacteraceae bacterium]|nr:hypothetical protein [Steroidobacteraceae bacterium]